MLTVYAKVGYQLQHVSGSITDGPAAGTLVHIVVPPMGHNVNYHGLIPWADVKCLGKGWLSVTARIGFYYCWPRRRHSG